MSHTDREQIFYEYLPFFSSFLSTSNRVKQIAAYKISDSIVLVVVDRCFTLRFRVEKETFFPYDLGQS